jgi:hypothetical protein
MANLSSYRINTINVQYLKALNVSRPEYKLLKYVARISARDKEKVCRAKPKTICRDIGWKVTSGFHRQVIRRLCIPITLHGKLRQQLLRKTELGLALTFKWNEDSYVYTPGNTNGATMVFPTLQKRLGLTDLQYGLMKLLEHFARKYQNFVIGSDEKELPYVSYTTNGLAEYLGIHPQNVRRLIRELIAKNFITLSSLAVPVEGFVNRVTLSKPVIVILKSIVEEEKAFPIPEAKERREDRLDRQQSAYIDRLTEEGKDWREVMGITPDERETELS